MSSFLVLREGDNRNRWRDGRHLFLCVQMLDKELWRLGPDGPVVFWCVMRRDDKTRERSPALEGKKGKSPALDRESMRGEMVCTGLAYEL
ncbi:hypothetical protein TNCV_1831311 [Trichonephila clavipes]|nr:hypothetical protein TNCV_1831311 [Trichonephila clavipes]